MTSKITFRLNGTERTVETNPLTPLLNVLREDAAATGTKYGCGEGECGACTIIMNDELVMSCLVPVIQAEGAEIETIEGLASKDANGNACLHPMQQAFLECGGAQCGICTPGMIMAAVHHARHPELAPAGVTEALEGNLCRCTGYTRIFEAVKRAGELAKHS